MGKESDINWKTKIELPLWLHKPFADHVRAIHGKREIDRFIILVALLKGLELSDRNLLDAASRLRDLATRDFPEFQRQVLARFRRKE